jgi:hydroxyethylthiazole kinase-like uncharacterized protein yjeF
MIDHAEVLSPGEMAEADRLAIANGTSGWRLMQNAAAAVAAAASEMASGRRVLALAGPGNNGGDALAAAALLRELGLEVRVGRLAGGAWSGDAARAADSWGGDVETLGPSSDLSADLVLDGLFGAGLARDLDGDARDIVGRINEAGSPVLAIDLPSGIDGATGQIRGAAIRAVRTVTFFRLKPGHLLYPGRGHCGAVEVADIGIPDAVLRSIRPSVFGNGPGLWSTAFPRPAPDGHKYARGHAIIVSGPAHATGAARLAAGAALRIGAGLVTVVARPEAISVNATHLTAVMVREAADAAALGDLLADRRLNAALIGPGAGRTDDTRQNALALLRSHAACVLDADAISVFQDDPEALFAAIAGRGAATVLTPHDGEFARLFPNLAKTPDKVLRAREAAKRSGAVVVLKGADTVVASPEGAACINATGSPFLATAGTGDVLAGMVLGLLAQGMEAFAAASAAVWMHGEAGRRIGPGLVSEDLAGVLPSVMRPLFEAKPAL